MDQHVAFVESLLADDRFALFRHPEEQAPDYHRVVLNPMDLTTVLRLLRSGELRTDDDVRSTLLSIWQNAVLYNRPPSRGTTAARDAANTLGDVVRRYFKSAAQKPPSAKRSRVSVVHIDHQQRKQQLDFVHLVESIDFDAMFDESVVQKYPHLREEYLRVVARPLDLRTIRNSIRSGSYNSEDGHERLYRALGTMFDNAVLFNSQEGEESIREWATVLRDKYMPQCAAETIRQDGERFRLARVQSVEQLPVLATAEMVAAFEQTMVRPLVRPPFAQPFDWERYECHDYPSVVRQPADFQTVLQKLKMGASQTWMQVRQDIERIADNAILYNRDKTGEESRHVLEEAMRLKRAIPQQWYVFTILVSAKHDHDMIFRPPAPPASPAPPARPLSPAPPAPPAAPAPAPLSLSLCIHRAAPRKRQAAPSACSSVMSTPPPSPAKSMCSSRTSISHAFTVAETLDLPLRVGMVVEYYIGGKTQFHVAKVVQVHEDQSCDVVRGASTLHRVRRELIRILPTSIPYDRARGEVRQEWNEQGLCRKRSAAAAQLEREAAVARVESVWYQLESEKLSERASACDAEEERAALVKRAQHESRLSVASRQRHEAKTAEAAFAQGHEWRRSDHVSHPLVSAMQLFLQFEAPAAAADADADVCACTEERRGQGPAPAPEPEEPAGAEEGLLGDPSWEACTRVAASEAGAAPAQRSERAFVMDPALFQRLVCRARMLDPLVYEDRVSLVHDTRRLVIKHRGAVFLWSERMVGSVRAAQMIFSDMHRSIRVAVKGPADRTFKSRVDALRSTPLSMGDESLLEQDESSIQRMRWATELRPYFALPLVWDEAGCFFVSYHSRCFLSSSPRPALCMHVIMPPTSVLFVNGRTREMWIAEKIRFRTITNRLT